MCTIACVSPVVSVIVCIWMVDCSESFMLNGGGGDGGSSNMDSISAHTLMQF